MVAAVALGFLCAAGVPAAAETPGASDAGTVRDARRERDEARAAQARAAAQIDVLRAEDDVLAAGLAGIEASVAAQQAAVDDARRSLEAAEQVARERAADVARIEDELAHARARVADIAVRHYVGSTFDDAATVVFDSTDATHAVRRAAVLEVLHGSERTTVDALRAREVERDVALAEARDAVAAAEAGRATLQAALDELAAQLATQERLRAALRERIAAWEREQDELAAEEAALTDLIRERQIAALGARRGGAGTEAYRGFVMPTAGAVGSRFGPRMHPIYRIQRMHAGVDMAGRTGDPVVAAKGGRVIFAGLRGGYGNVVIIEHSGGVTTVSAHLSRIETAAGAEVAAGQRVGRIGSTGLSTGPHLHFEVRVDGVAQDPELFLP